MRCHETDPRGRGGLTLLEAMIALTLIGLSSLAILEALATQLQGATKMRESSLRIDLARNRLARLELLSREALIALPDSLRRGSVRNENGTLAWQAQTVGITGIDGLYDLRVLVSGNSGLTELRTRVFRPPQTVDSP